MAKKSLKPAKKVRSQKGKKKSARVPARRASGRGRGQKGARGIHLARISDDINLPSGAVYLYAITADKQVKPVKLPIIGIDGAGQVIGVPLADFTAWVSGIDAASFAEALEQNMENLDWLAEATLRHQRAVTAIANSAPRTLLPTRFGVVFSSLAALDQDIRTRSKDLARAAKRVEGCEEWGVKVFQVVRPSSAVFKTATSGSDYLRKKAEALGGDGSARDESMRAFAKALQKIARDVAPTGKVSSGQKGLLWQATFLVPRTKRKQWDNVLRKFAQHWAEECSIECTGPWPPYSFVTSDHA